LIGKRNIFGNFPHRDIQQKAWLFLYIFMGTCKFTLGGTADV